MNQYENHLSQARSSGAVFWKSFDAWGKNPDFKIFLEVNKQCKLIFTAMTKPLVDAMEVTTSEEIKEEVEKFKNTRKAKYATSSNNLVKMKTVLSHHVPSQFNSLFSPYDYMLYKNDNEEKAVNSEEGAEAMIKLMTVPTPRALVTQER